VDATVILFVIAALALGALLGWLLGSRGAAAGKGVADALRLQLDAVREERDAHAAALDALRGDPGAFDLVLTDQTMPGMTGLDLAQACRGVAGAPRVVLYTGYAEKLSRGAPEGAGVAALVRKPIDPTSLFATLKSHLRKDASAAARADAGR
jgi:CheY-like chemotaxis protein